MSENFIRPKALKMGARVAVVSPASTPKEERVRAGMEALRAKGYEPVLYPSALARGPLYYAGAMEARLKDLHAAFADDSIDGILCTRGGWGSAELLPHLDKELIAAHPKVFVGYSDHTSLHCWLQNEVGLGTFYGPMVAADFSKADGVDAASWDAALGGREKWDMGAPEGLRVLREGSAEGVVLGGCVSILAESMGTAYAGETDDAILFLEDIGTKPYQWDRMLLHLKYAGRLDSVRGIVFGDMQQCVDADEMELLEAALLHALADFAGPIAIGLRCGHVDSGNVTLPLGVRARLSCEDGARLEFLESAVSI